eukprot:scaffold13642_cov148-Isochrysis_galbana.AAC.4
MPFFHHAVTARPCIGIDWHWPPAASCLLLVLAAERGAVYYVVSAALPHSHTRASAGAGSKESPRQRQPKQRQGARIHDRDK